MFATVALLAVVSACAPTSGSPKPQSSPDPQGTTTTTESATARPREITLTGKDPCQLLTAEQLPALKIDREGRPRHSDLYKTTGCAWTVNGAGNSIVPVTSEGIGAWRDGTRQGEVTEIDPVLGFPAIKVTIPSDENACDVHVDTADGQYLAVAFSVLPTYEDRFPKPCDGARALAEAAMRNLLR
ncbi:Protein of unknown function [Lentzea fradiae]|uniref:DUF3558 domain-containing protein n=1 Tax=Lentzea fradiae TaxID=200378 RepID=A0A1G7XUR3_9PSEU|nr:DUF3558 domain-containing protein [Lentzea fradiae]SDG87500.1 Protein of unknown function [Lentzea fradiae]